MRQRVINTKIWSDTWFRGLDLSERMLFIYLLTNERTNIAGVYELPTDMMSDETKIEEIKIKDILAKFEKDGKITYRFGWLYLRNFLRYQELKSFKVIRGIERIIEEIPKNVLDLIGYQYPSGYFKLPDTHLNLNPNLNSNSNFNLERGRNIPYPKGMEEAGTISPAQEARLFFENEEFRKKVISYFTEEKGVPVDYIGLEIPKFISYWTEPNKSGSKQRWELERTFEIKRRLLTWFSRAAQYQKEKSPKNKIGIAI
jgi:hypothetical protein